MTRTLSGSEEKYRGLVELLKATGGVVIAYSGGVDSTLLLVAAVEALGAKVFPAVAVSPSMPRRELETAQEMAGRLKVRLRIVALEELADPRYAANPPDRCFHCKSHLFCKLAEIAREEGVACVADGANVDDLADFRPGLEAARELGVRHPLIEAGLHKEEIRALLKERGIPIWNRPAAACLASRIPYGRPVTVEKLRRIEAAEDGLLAMGFRVVRVRDWDQLAVVEVGCDELPRLFEPEMREAVCAAVKRAGYGRVALDGDGYRQGALNEGLVG